MLRVALIGLGMAVEPHAASLLECQDEVEVRWATSPSAARTNAFAARYPFQVTNDVAMVLRDPDVDAIMLLTPPNTHLELAREAFAHGKHLLIEKPLDVTIARAEAIVGAAEAAHLRLGVVLQHRFRPAATRLSELLQEETLGPIQAASLAVPWWRPQSYYDEPGRGTLARDGGGALMTQAIHSLDLFRAMLGPVEILAAEARTTALHKMETEDLALALLRLRDGAVGSLMATTAFYPGAAERIDIIGAAGTAQLLGSTLDVRWLDGRVEQIGGSEQTGGAGNPMNFPHHPHKALIADFCRAVAEHRPPKASGQEALATQRLVEALLRKARERT
jgi:predicted dehydrogenase